MDKKIIGVKVCDCGKPLVMELPNEEAFVLFEGLVVHSKGCVKQKG